MGRIPYLAVSNGLVALTVLDQVAEKESFF